MNKRLKAVAIVVITGALGQAAPAAASPPPVTGPDLRVRWGPGWSANRLAMSRGSLVAHLTGRTTNRVEIVGRLYDRERPGSGGKCAYARLRPHKIGGGWGATWEKRLCRHGSSSPIHIVWHDVDQVRLVVCQAQSGHRHAPSNCGSATFIYR